MNIHKLQYLNDEIIKLDNPLKLELKKIERKENEINQK